MYTLEEVTELFWRKKRVVTSTEYLGVRKPIEYTCSCGKSKCTQTLEAFNQGRESCPDCRRNNGRKSTTRTKWTLELVKKEFEVRGHILMTEEYINSTTDMEYICRCKNPIRCHTSITKLLMGRDNCTACANAKKKHPPLTQEIVRARFAAKEKTLLDDVTYKNTETLMHYKCKCGNEDCWVTVGNMDKGEDACLSCSVKKRETTMLARHGVKNAMKSEVFKAKARATNTERLGVPYPMMHPDVRAKRVATCWIRFGAANPMQNQEVFDKWEKAVMKKSPYIFPSGAEMILQGFEHFAMDKLLAQGVKEEDLIEGRKNLPNIWYWFDTTVSQELRDRRNQRQCAAAAAASNSDDTDENDELLDQRDEVHPDDERLHRYFTDIYIPSQNKIIEVKCEYTYYRQKARNDCKMLAAVAAGFQAELHIYSRKGELLSIITYNNNGE